MTEWQIKEISELTKISVRMLRHYDKIGLLKPSYRLPNGYRCYTAGDLAKLQQIIALKYFGFDLSTIKGILQKHQNIYAHLQAQQQILKKQTDQLLQVNNALANILDRLSPTDTPNWNDLITLIERYRMTENLREKLKKSWAGQQLTEPLFEAYLVIYEQFPEEFSAWDKIVEQINNKEVGDPAGPDGERVVLCMQNLAKTTKKILTQQMKFGASVLENIKSGKLSQLQVTPEGLNWISRATVSYWLKRWDTIYDAIIENLKSDPEGKVGKKIADQWTGLIDEFFSYTSRPLAIGMILWQETARQAHELNQEAAGLKPMPAAQDLVKQVHMKLLFNPDAMSWISRAIEVHAC